jgi:RHS repeat-associated protein
LFAVLVFAGAPVHAVSLNERVTHVPLPQAAPASRALAAVLPGSTAASDVPTSATTTSSDGITTVYRFDADGFLVGETRQPGTPTEQRLTYLVDTLAAYPVIVEEWTNEQLTRSYEWGPSNELISFTDHASDDSTVTHFAHLDGFGSVRFLTDRAGNITDTFEYDAFGNIIARTGTTRLPHLYRSERQDPNSGFYYLRARWMDPKTGRFTQMDSFDGWNTDPSSLHKYTYTHNDPVNNVDPSGKAISIAQLATASAILGTLVAVAQSPYGPFKSTPGQRFVASADLGESQEIGDVIVGCFSEHYDLDDVGIRTIMAAAAIPIYKPWAGLPIVGRASRFTNALSLLGHYYFRGDKMSFKLLGTNRAFGAAGRANVVAGAGVAAYDMTSIALCVNHNL